MKRVSIFVRSSACKYRMNTVPCNAKKGDLESILLRFCAPGLARLALALALALPDLGP
jgi:hypothetical protein